MQKYLLTTVKEYLFITLTLSILLLFSSSKSFSQENVFTVENVEVSGRVDKNFSRDRYINKALIKSFKVLMSKILVSSDLEKIENIDAKKIKYLISSFKIIEEKYRKAEYEATFSIYYSDRKVKKFLSRKNISFSQPEKVSAVFFPALFVNDEVKSFNDNFFYQNWLKNKIENQLIDYVLPFEDLEDLSKVQKLKDSIGDFDIKEIVGKYNNNNYVFILMYYKNNKMKTHIKTSFNGNAVSKNFSYIIDDIKDDEKLNFILNDMKKKITDIWKESNYINLLMPLSITAKYKQKNIKDLDDLRNILYKISIVENFNIEEINVNYSSFKIYYFGNPKKLKTELHKFGYVLQDKQDTWELYYNK